MSKNVWNYFSKIRPTEEEMREWPIERIEREWVIPTWVEEVINSGKKSKKIKN